MTKIPKHISLPITEIGVRKILAKAVTANRGTQADFARNKGMSKAYLSDVLSGRRTPGKKILDALGLRRVVMYEFLREKPTRRKTAPVAPEYWQTNEESGG